MNNSLKKRISTEPINLTVTDIQTAVEFLETYFELQSMGANTGMAVLTDEDDFVLTVMRATDTETVTYPSGVHIGFFVENEETVGEIHRNLTADGLDVEPPEHRNHSYNLYVDAPGGFTIEVGA